MVMKGMTSEKIFFWSDSIRWALILSPPPCDTLHDDQPPCIKKPATKWRTTFGSGCMAMGYEKNAHSVVIDSGGRCLLPPEAKQRTLRLQPIMAFYLHSVLWTLSR